MNRFKDLWELEAILVSKYSSAILIGLTLLSVVVVFRGSANIQNWFNNLKFFKKNYKSVSGAQVHIGFSDSFDSVKGVFHSAMKKARSYCPGCKHITVTGHSLGGALSVLAALELQESSAYKGFSYNVVTFGSPRVGNDVFAKIGRAHV